VLPPWARGGSGPNLRPPGRRTYRHGAEGSELVLPVERGSIRGVVEGEEGVLEGAMVRVAIESEGAERVWPPVQSDVEGKFRVGDLPVEHVYTVTVRAGDGRGRTSVFVESLPADPIRIDVRDDD
jgi:hypothetical protein